MATTAAGNVAETVMPAFMPRYALAAPRTTAIMMPRKTALKGEFLHIGLGGNEWFELLIAHQAVPPGLDGTVEVKG